MEEQDLAFDLHPCVQLVDPGEEWGWVEFGVGPSDEAVMLCARFEDIARFYERDGGGTRPSFARTKTVEPVDALAVVQSPDGTHRTQSLTGLDLAFPKIQVLPDGDILVVGGRCRHHEDGPEHNAAIFGADGLIVATGCLGDGIRDVMAASDGTIWVSYLDEGVFGNFGWGEPNRDPIGASGLVAFDRSLARIFEFPSSKEFGPIYDCYALTLDGDTAWISYYGGGSIVRVGDPPTGWKRGPFNATTLVASGDRAGVFARGEHGFIAGSLTDGRFEVRGRRPLRMPDGYDAPGQPTYLTRNGSLFLFTESLDWFHLTLDSAFTQLGFDR